MLTDITKCFDKIKLTDLINDTMLKILVKDQKFLGDQWSRRMILLEFCLSCLQYLQKLLHCYNMSQTGMHHSYHISSLQINSQNINTIESWVKQQSQIRFSSNNDILPMIWWELVILEENNLHALKWLQERSKDSFFSQPGWGARPPFGHMSTCPEAKVLPIQ